MSDDGDDIPGWDRVKLRTQVFASTDREGEPCLSFYSFQFPGSLGSNGFIRRTDIHNHSYVSWGDWDDVTREAGLAQLEKLGAEFDPAKVISEDDPRLKGRISLLETAVPLSHWKAAQEPFTQNAIEISRPLTLARNTAPAPALRLQLKKGAAR